MRSYADLQKDRVGVDMQWCRKGGVAGRTDIPEYLRQYIKTTQVPSWIKFTMAGTGNDRIASLFVTSIIDEPAITAVVEHTHT
jgi:hypothetical protein